jgi:hypothetical protein
MPTAGTHITILERLADTGKFDDIIGRNADPTKFTFAKLGAIGPDIFYALMDYGPELQNFANFMSKLAGSIECITSLTKDIDTKLKDVEDGITLGTSKVFRDAVEEFQQTFGLVVALIHQGLMAWVIQQGVNLFPIFEARRQQDRPRTSWFWADYLHYVRTGQFVRELFVQSAGKPYFRAFAYGYLTHYVTDVVGHPFINEIVGSPWRMYWQRHHLVENFVDAYIWDRWHDSHPELIDPKTGEQLLDTIRSAPGATGDGASFTFARLNDHINIGIVAGNDPIDKFIMDICANIRAGLENMGVLHKVPDAPNDADLNDWANTLATVFRNAYPPAARPPTNLPGGYPTPDDIKQAYSLLRLFLRISTEESITEPKFPDILGDVWNAVKDLWDSVEKKLGSAPPFPSPGIPGSFEDLWEAIKQFVDWAVRTAIAIGEAAFEFIKKAIAVGGVLLLDSIRAGLYLVKKALFDIYKYFRFFLVRAAYTLPFTDELTEEIAGGINAMSLWNTPLEPPLFSFPKEEISVLERTRYPSHYVPWVPPELLADMPKNVLVEQPQTWMGPYPGGASADAFIDPPVGRRIMLSPNGPINFNVLVTPGTPFQPPPDFGGAIGNCADAFRTVLAAEKAGNIPRALFPDYNLDGDRGYGWPCWDVRHPPGTGGAFDHLDPPPRGTVRVDPVPIF